MALRSWSSVCFEAETKASIEVREADDAPLSDRDSGVDDDAPLSDRDSGVSHEDNEYPL